MTMLTMLSRGGCVYYIPLSLGESSIGFHLYLQLLFERYLRKYLIAGQDGVKYGIARYSGTHVWGPGYSNEAPLESG